MSVNVRPGSSRGSSDVVRLIARCCERPLMYLADPDDPAQVDFHLLWAFIEGYAMCEADLGVQSEIATFREWLFARRPELRSSSRWFGDMLVAQRGGDALKAAEELRGLCLEYLRGRG